MLKVITISETPIEENWLHYFQSQKARTVLVRGGLALKNRLKEEPADFALWFWGARSAELFVDLMETLANYKVPVFFTGHIPTATKEALTDYGQFVSNSQELHEYIQDTKNATGHLDLAKHKQPDNAQLAELRFRNMLQHGEHQSKHHRKKIFLPEQMLEVSEKQSLLTPLSVGWQIKSKLPKVGKKLFSNAWSKKIFPSKKSSLNN